MLTLFLIILFATAAGCFFTATNYALVDYSRGKLRETLAARFSQAKAEKLAERLAEMRDGLLLLTSLSRTILNFVILLAMIGAVAPPGEPTTGWWDVATAVLASGLIIAVFGVAIPVSWSRHGAEQLLAGALPILRLLHAMFGPVFVALHLFDPVVRRLLGVPLPHEDDRTPVEQEILDAVTEGELEGHVDEQQKEMIEAVVEFPSMTVDQIMVPRTDVLGVEVHSSLGEVKKFFADTGHSRVPVYVDDLDHIAGVLYVKDLLTLLGSPAVEPFDLRNHIREAIFVPESKTLRDLLHEFKTSKVHMAIVLDEYGGTSGLITIEDIVEEIIGDIQDEYEKAEEPPEVRRLEDGAYEVSGRARIAELNGELQLELPEDEDYDTLGGFVFATLGAIPVAGEHFDHDGLRFTVTEAEKTRVNTVRIETVIDAEVTEPAEHAD